LTRSFERFRESGLRVRISENDVTDDDGPSAQADQYAAVLAACFQHPNCVSYTTWGVDDRYDWWIDDDGSLQQGHDLLFDDGEPTAAYDAMRRVLQN
jgi:endo-1,4-beta-xylanase